MGNNNCFKWVAVIKFSEMNVKAVSVLFKTPSHSISYFYHFKDYGCKWCRKQKQYLALNLFGYLHIRIHWQQILSCNQYFILSYLSNYNKNYFKIINLK